MAPARLKAAHEDLQRLRQSRRTIPPLPGLNDYRSILHAHAQDSAHTGGTRDEMLADAKRAGVRAILLSDHHRPPRDFFTDTWRGLHDGVLFIPGCEARGFLLLPTRSIMGRMHESTSALLGAAREGGGLAFLSHVEERPDHPMTDLDGLEVYNRHADATKDKAGMLSLILKLTDPDGLRELEESLRLYPDELFAAQVGYPADSLAKWDAESKSRRLTGVAANDYHHNQIWVVKVVDEATVKVGTSVDADGGMRTITAALRPGVRALTKGRRPGEVLARLDFDPYHRSFLNVSTHLLAPELSEGAVRTSLRSGHAYVSHDWMCDPSGFRFELVLANGAEAGRHVVMGDEVAFSRGGRLVARFPVPCRIRLLSGGRVVADRSADGLDHEVTAPGVYRVEGWLGVGGEERPWVYSNPIYVRGA
jgi:hypothetical protein